ncbi:hypothetical protein XELAEV_18045769mg [Xenopus laevis]|uniref:Secreted protein n=1 Tax=Xenopus laevis TaxID=8355 RepID=A0A974C166_XENLA|nr:hypothetical protein XELAEV_18045769mg [Xenopus laevis]
MCPNCLHACLPCSLATFFSRLLSVISSLLPSGFTSSLKNVSPTLFPDRLPNGITAAFSIACSLPLPDGISSVFFAHLI